MKIKAIIGFAISGLLLSNCGNGNNENVNNGDDIKQIEIPTVEAYSPSQEVLDEGLLLTEQHCFSCHSPSASMKDRSAPPLEAVKRHYINSETNIEDFTQTLISFLEEPTEEKTKMPGALKRFNLMPKMNISHEQITQIANYIYYAELEKPEWLDRRYTKKDKRTANAELTPIENGKNIALEVKGILEKNLGEALKNGGPVNALNFCSTRAIPLTDSMSIALNAQIKRVSDNNRNLMNKANSEELAYIKATKSLIAQNKEPLPKLITTETKNIGFYPIIANQKCLKCHGQVDAEVMPETYAAIKNLYPKDKATGYSTGELRGIWVVEMDIQ